MICRNCSRTKAPGRRDLPVRPTNGAGDRTHAPSTFSVPEPASLNRRPPTSSQLSGEIGSAFPQFPTLSRTWLQPEHASSSTGSSSESQGGENVHAKPLPQKKPDAAVDPPVGCGRIDPCDDTCCDQAQETNGPIRANGKLARTGGAGSMTRLKIQCPKCGKVHEIAGESLGARAVCKHCQHAFKISMDQSAALPEELESGSDQGPEARPAASIPGAGKPKISEKIGKYQVKGTLGAGAMGEVYRGWDPLLARSVAIKILPREFSRDKARVRRFQIEARSIAKLDHTNVVSVFEIGQDEDLVYIAMQFVDGGSLDGAVKKDRPMDWREATRVIRDAAAGLGGAHDEGIIHRDVKPANLLRNQKGVTRVADFGLAKALGATHQITGKNAVLGTPAYMAPEQWINKGVDHRSDLYSLVVTYYHLLTGETPFDAPELFALQFQHAKEPLPDPREHVAGLPDGVCRIPIRGTQKDQADRYQSAEELIAALTAVLETPEESMFSGTPWEQLVVQVEADEFATLSDDPAAAIHPGVGSQAQRALQRIRSKPPTSKSIGVGLIGFFAFLCLGVIIYISTDYGMVKIELPYDDPDMVVKVDDNTITLGQLEEPLKIKVGPHGLEVESEIYEFVGPDSFQVKRGVNGTVEVELVAKVSGLGPPLRPPPPSEGWIDLLEHVDLERDHVAGDWKQNGSALTAAQGRSSRVMLPAIVEGSYEFEVEFVKEMESGSVSIVFPVQWQPCSLVLRCGDNAGSAFSRLGNLKRSDENDSFVSRGIECNHSHRLRVSIEVESGDPYVSLTAILDEKPLTSWRGLQSQVGVGKDFVLPRSRQLGLLAYNSSASFLAARVRPSVPSGCHEGIIRPLRPNARHVEPFLLTQIVGGPEAVGSKMSLPSIPAWQDSSCITTM